MTLWPSTSMIYLFLSCFVFWSIIEIISPKLNVKFTWATVPHGNYSPPVPSSRKLRDSCFSFFSDSNDDGDCLRHRLPFSLPWQSDRTITLLFSPGYSPLLWVTNNLYGDRLDFNNPIFIFLSIVFNPVLFSENLSKISLDFLITVFQRCQKVSWSILALL